MKLKDVPKPLPMAENTSMKTISLIWIGFELALVIVLLNEIRVAWEDDVGLRRLEAHLEEQKRLKASKASQSRAI